MKLATFSRPGNNGEMRLGAVANGKIADLVVAHAFWVSLGNKPVDKIFDGSRALASVKDLLAFGDDGLNAAKKLVGVIEGNQETFEDAGQKMSYDRSELVLLPPCPNPGKFISIGCNYRSHIEELMEKGLIKVWPQKPVGFVKFDTSIVGDDAEVVCPDDIKTLDYEPEMAFVIKKEAYRVKQKDAMDYVAGIVCTNDLSARAVQAIDVEHATRIHRGKNLPGFAPIGPYLVTLDEVGDTNNLDLKCIVNGETRIHVNTDELLFKIPEIIEHYSEYTPLRAGDTLSTGAPGDVAVSKPNPEDFYLKPGDVVEIELEKVGRLRTTIVGP